jgi:predicted aspartyl protease
MMRLTLCDELPFITVTVTNRGATVQVPDMLIDTGSASTLLNADIASRLGIVPEPTDRLRTLRGVGGREVVFTRQIDRLDVGSRGVEGFEVEIGGMDYGFSISGILGMDFLTSTGAILNLRDLTLDFA